MLPLIYEAPWVLVKVPQRASLRNVLYHPEDVYVVHVVVPVPADPEKLREFNLESGTFFLHPSPFRMCC